MPPAAIGLVLATLLAVIAFSRSRRPPGYYEHELYGMSASAHLRYAAAGAVFAIAFAAALFIPKTPALPMLAVFAVIAILYGASFIRGAVGEDEAQ